MSYFDYLSMTNQKDTKETFEKYLVEILDYEEKKAEQQSKIYYKESEQYDNYKK